MMLSKIVKLSGLVTVSELFPWTTASSFMLLFTLFNCLFFLSAKQSMKYWQFSMYSFFGLAVLSGGAAYLFSMIPIGEAGSYRWIFIVVAIGYLVFLSLMTLMRNIVEFAEREEWTQPRRRRKK